MITYEVKVDSKNIIRRLRRLETDLQKTSEYNVDHVGRWIRDNLKLHIPKDTGESARSIIISKLIKSKTKHSLVVRMAFNPHNRKWNTNPFYLPQWFMQSELARREQRRYSGNINEYRNVVPEAKRTFGIRIRDDIKNATRTK